MALVSPANSLVGYDGRSPSTKGRIMTLPRIEHPSKRMQDENRNELDIRGTSRQGGGDGRPLRSESGSPQHRRRSSSFRSYQPVPPISESLPPVPEHVNAVYSSDADKVRLPVFGHRADSSTSSYGVDSGKATPMTSRLVLDELEASLRERVRSQFHDVRTKFRHAAAGDGAGRISREALGHLIAAIFGTQRQIGPGQMDKLLERLNLKDSNKISFDQFIGSLFGGDGNVPEWVSRSSTSPLHPSSPETTKRTAAQMFLILKEKARTKHKDLVALCPALDGGPPSRLFKAQFHNALLDMGYRMKDTEFDKLWDKFDTDGFHAVHSDKFLKRLFNESVGTEPLPVPISETQEQQAAILRAPHVRSSHSDSEVHTPRPPGSRGQLDENQIQQWLNYKFPQGFGDLERALERLDTKQMGTLPRDRFLEELKRFGLKLEDNLLEFFLKRLSVDLTLTSGSVPYRDVINVFKQRTDPTRRRINADNEAPQEESRQTSLERQIQQLLAIHFDRVKDQLTRGDTANLGTINSNDFRSVIEDLLEFPLRPDEFYQLLKGLPMDEHGRIKYRQYLKDFQPPPSLAPPEDKSVAIPQWDYMRSTDIRERLDQQHTKRKHRRRQRQSLDVENDNDNGQRTRSIEELREMLKNLIRTRYKDIEDQFKIIDRSSYGELTQDLLFDLFRRLALIPEVTRTEVALLWSRCHLKENGHLDFYQFLREFGYSKRSATYPNAKRNPPRKGDADFLLTSRKLYGDSVLVHGTALNAIRANWDELRREFAELDPYQTGFVMSDEFDDILVELCPSVNQEDLDTLKYKFQNKTDSRMNYVRFLKYHAPLPEMVGLIDEGSKHGLPAINDGSPRAASDRSALAQLSNKLRRRLTDSYKALRRAFKQHDSANTGSVPVKVFKDILGQFKCPLNDEELYGLTSQIDTRMDGTINYNYFLQQYIKAT